MSDAAIKGVEPATETMAAPVETRATRLNNFWSDFRQ